MPIRPVAALPLLLGAVQLPTRHLHTSHASSYMVRSAKQSFYGRCMCVRCAVGAPGNEKPWDVKIKGDMGIQSPQREDTTVDIYHIKA